MLPLIYYNTTVLMLDDSSSFLDTVSLKLKQDGKTVVYTDQKQALDAIRSQKAIFSDYENFIQIIEDPDNESNFERVNFTLLREVVASNISYNDISVLVVDYQMPGENGYEFCRQFKDLPIKIIMLTGEASYEMAVEALNQGIIDIFLKKEQDHLASSLLGHVQSLKKEYFHDFSSMLPASEGMYLSNRDYIEVVNNWITEHDISQYALYDQLGSRVGKDKHGKLRLLCFMSQEDLDYDYQQAIEHNADSNVITQLASGEYALPRQAKLGSELYREYSFDNLLPITGEIQFGDSHKKFYYSTFL